MMIDQGWGGHVERTMSEERRRALVVEADSRSTRRVLLPHAGSFEEVLSFVCWWDHEVFNARHGMVPDARPKGRTGVFGVELGPFCSIQARGSRHAAAVLPTDVAVDALTPWVLGDENESWSFKAIEHDNGAALIVGECNIILSDIWLAYVDAATVPVPTSAAVQR